MVFFNNYFFIYISIHKLKVLDTQNPWKWRCPKHCCNRQSVVTSTCFLNATKKFYNEFVATYMWIHEYPPKIIVRESGIYQDTLTGLTYHWREIMELENENQGSIHGLMGKN